MNIIWYPAQPGSYTVPASPRRIDMIVMHSTGGVKSGDLWTLSGRDRRHLVSVHYYVTKLGEIYHLVHDKDIAWHAGVSAWEGESDCNRFSIGIELENLNTGSDPYPQAQIDAVLWLVTMKVQQYRIPQARLVRHAQIAIPPGRKLDPVNFPWDRFVADVYPPPWPRVYRVKYDQVWVREGPSTATPHAWNGTATLPKDKELAIAGIVTGERYRHPTLGESDQWAHWLPAGFIWLPQLEEVRS